MSNNIYLDDYFINSTVDFNIRDGDLISSRPKKASIKIYYDGELVNEMKEANLEWKTGVCNHCGGSPDCHDDMWNAAFLEIEAPILINKQNLWLSD